MAPVNRTPSKRTVSVVWCSEFQDVAREGNLGNSSISFVAGTVEKQSRIFDLDPLLGRE